MPARMNDRPPDLLGLIVSRRSCRAFSSDPIDGADLDAIEAASSSFPTIHGRRSGSVSLIRDPDKAGGLARILTGGVVAKCNLWILRGGPPPAFLVCKGARSLSTIRRGLHLYNVDASLAGEVAVLEAASRGIESVWLAAIDEREVVSFLGLSPDVRVPALIALGRMRPRGGIYHGMTQRWLSGRRRPLSGIVHSERFGSPLPVPPPDHEKRGDMLSSCGGRPAGPVDVRIPAPCPAFSGQPGDEDLRLMLDAARWAPNADNSQIWRWIVVRERAVIEAVLAAAGVPGASACGDFALVAACAAPFFIKHRSKEQPFALIDVPIAAVHLIAMGAALGLGWNLLFDMDDLGAARALGLPGDHTLVGLLLVGRPAPDAAGLPPWQQML